jgi:hypothetical protein
MQTQLLVAALVLLVIVVAAAVHARRAHEDFQPIPQLNCDPNRVASPEYAVDMTMRNAAGTVAWVPYSTQSRVSLERAADSPEVATPPNPVTGVGASATVRRLGDRYRRGEQLAASGIYDLAPGEPGYMEAVGDLASSAMAAISRRSPGAAAPSPACRVSAVDLDADFATDGLYDDALLEADAERRRERMTSDRTTVQNTLTASRTGLGSTRRDPRFEPGPQWRVPGGDASWAQGGHAGGPTSGAYAPAVFAPPAAFGTFYVAGFGDPNDLYGTRRTAEVIDEEPSTWTH